MATVRLSPLEERHFSEIVAVERASQSSPWAEASFRNELGHDRGVFVVAEDPSGVIGYVVAWIIVDELHIINIAVHPDRRREGIARKLIQEAILQSQDRGATCATLEVRASNEAAIRLYESFGFVQAGLRKKYYPDNKEDAVVMWLYSFAEVA